MPTKDLEKRRAQWKSWYERNKHRPEYKKKIRDFDKKRRADLCSWVSEYKAEHKCKECGFANPLALDFHHRDPENKVCEVSVMARKSLSKKRIIEEIAKCDILCANCHRILHGGDS